MSVPTPYSLRNGDWDHDPSWQTTADLAEFHAGKAITAISLMDHYLSELRTDEDVNAYMAAAAIHSKVAESLDAVPASEAFELRRQVDTLLRELNKAI